MQRLNGIMTQRFLMYTLAFDYLNINLHALLQQEKLCIKVELRMLLFMVMKQ